MKIDVKDSKGDSAFNFTVDLGAPPTVVRPRGSNGKPVTLDWDRAMDDQKYLRHCLVCGCSDLFAHKTFPQVTGFALLIFAAVVASVLFGFGEVGLALIALGVVLFLDLAIYLFSPRILTCYRCGSDYRSMKIRPGQPKWDASLAERYKREHGTRGGSS